MRQKETARNLSVCGASFTRAAADCGAYGELIVTLRSCLGSVRLVSFELLGATLSAAPAAAQGLFDTLFNGDRYSARQGSYAPRGGSAYAPPGPSYFG